jgi:metal-responsive CopG/Arc/MetJ family transcriptional regulator
MRWWSVASSIRVTTRLPAELVARIDQVAAHSNQSRTEVIRAALELYIGEAEDLLKVLDGLKQRDNAVLDPKVSKRGRSGS